MGDLEPGVALTFDDASVDEWVNLLPMFERYKVQATFFICTDCSYLPLDKLKVKEIFEAGNEIGSHSLHHYSLSQYLNEHTIGEYYSNEVVPTLRLFDSLSIPVTSFAYPYGDHNSAADKYLSRYFQKIRGVCSLLPSANGAYIIHQNTQFVKGCYLDRAAHLGLNDYKNAIKEAKSHRAVVVFIGHKPGPDVSNDWSFPVSLLDSICKYTVQQNMKFYRLMDL